MSWVLRPLLDLRRRGEREATGALGRAVSRSHAAEVAALGLRREAAETAGRALRAGPGNGMDLARWTARLRLEAERLRGLAAEAEARAQAEAVVVGTHRVALRQAALRREVVEQLEATWRRARALMAARRAETALDDRPWRQRFGFSSSWIETRP